MSHKLCLMHVSDSRAASDSVTDGEQPSTKWMRNCHLSATTGSRLSRAATVMSHSATHSIGRSTLIPTPYRAQVGGRIGCPRFRPQAKDATCNQSMTPHSEGPEFPRVRWTVGTLMWNRTMCYLTSLQCTSVTSGWLFRPKIRESTNVGIKMRITCECMWACTLAVPVYFHRV